MKKILLISLSFLLFISGIYSNNLYIDKILTYHQEGSEVIFKCEDSIQVLVKVISPGIIKLWYTQNIFKQNHPSFAVINDSFEKNENLNILEQSDHFEIYTGELIIRIQKNPFQITFLDKYQKKLLADYQNKGYVKEADFQKTCKLLHPDEQFFGLGEKNGSLNRRGHIFKMWNSDKPCYDVNEDPLYKSIPFFMSNYGYGIFFDNTYKSEFDFGADTNEFFSFGSHGGEMIYYFIYGPSYKKIIERYTQLTGQPIMPPEWALGFAQSRGLYTNEKLTREVANEFRKRQIPCDIIYQDIGWTEYLQNFNWKKENYQNPRQMLSDLSAQGFKVIVSQDPVISNNNITQWKEADSLKFFAIDQRTGKTYNMPWPWGGNCGIVDFTNPAVADWWGNYQQKSIDDGVRGFWTDMGEPAWCNEEETDRLNIQHFLGNHAEIHNVYGLLWDKIVTEQFEQHNPNQRVFQMTRAGFSGLQRYTFGWSGDSGNGDNVLLGWNKLAAQIPLAQSAGLGLIPFWTTDISGYCGDINDREAMAELYIRWMQFGIFNPLSRAHHEGNNAVEPWSFGPLAEKICREAISLKYKLHPYIYTYAREAYDTGLPLIRAIFLEYPDDPVSSQLNDQFLFGKELLVAPVIEKNATQRKIYLPEGEWIDYNHPTNIFEGKQWISYPVTLETIPVFVKRGSIIPEMPVQQYIGEIKNIPVWFNIYPAPEGKITSFRLYEDDGETNNYKKDIYGTTSIQCLTQNKAFEISITSENRNGWKIIERNEGIKINMKNSPKNVMFNGKRIKSIKIKDLSNNWYQFSEKPIWSWDKTNQTLWIKFKRDDSPIKIIIIQ